MSASIVLNNGYIPPLETFTCPICATVHSNSGGDFLREGVSMTWWEQEDLTERRHSRQTLQEHRLWVCSEECAREAPSVLEALAWLRQVTL